MYAVAMPVTALVTPGPEVTMNRALLVAHQDMLHLVLLEELVVDEQHRAAGIAENVLHALFLQAADDDLGAGEGGGLDSVHLSGPARKRRKSFEQ
jgi:hypothetical protein